MIACYADPAMLRMPAGALQPCTRSAISPQHMHQPGPQTGTSPPAPSCCAPPSCATLVSALARHTNPALLARHHALGRPARALPVPPRRVHQEPGPPAPAQRGAQAQARNPFRARRRGGRRVGAGARARVHGVGAQAAARGSRRQRLPWCIRRGGGV